MLALATTSGQTSRAVILALAYSLGLGIPFVLFGLFFRKLLGVFRAIRRNSRWVTRVGGALLILVGLALVTGGWNHFLVWLHDHVRLRRGDAAVTVVEERAAPAAAPPPRPANRLWALLRNSWRQLTSMRTALVLLFLLAVAAIPGSVFPQRAVNARAGRRLLRRAPEPGALAGAARRLRRSTRRPGSPRSTCCCSPR